MEKSLLLLMLFTTTPFTIFLLGSFNYYWDYIGSVFESNTSGEVFDFIVVGSGSSGAVVAYRLAQHYKVLLLEAGGRPTFLNNIPGLALDLLGYPQFDWRYKTVRQTASGFSLENNQFTANRGKVLGGSSIINYMLYLRGHPLDYDNWANITGDSSWKYENVLPFFKKSILEYRGKSKNNKEHYGNSPYGFLTIEEMSWKPLLDRFFRAGEELGYKSDIDANGPQTAGFGSFEVTQNRGQRGSTYTTILRDLQHNPNIRILTYAQATKISIDQSKKANGVYYYHHGIKKFSAVSKEIILSCGSYDSPKLLMLSGVGPKNELELLGIKPKVNLPVGKNLQDHFGSFIFPITINSTISFSIERDFGIHAFYEYFSKGLGKEP